MELEDPVVYNSNVAYLNTEDIQQQHVNTAINHNEVKTPIKFKQYTKQNQHFDHYDCDISSNHYCIA